MVYHSISRNNIYKLFTIYMNIFLLKSKDKFMITTGHKLFEIAIISLSIIRLSIFTNLYTTKIWKFLNMTVLKKII